jgi:hypothetical protein
MTLPQFYPSQNPYNLVPSTTFGSIINAAAWAEDGRFPKRTNEAVEALTDSLSWIRGAHSLKFGFYGERWRGGGPAIVNFNGTFDFTPNPNNPNDTGYAYGNAIIGTFNSYWKPRIGNRMAFRARMIQNDSVCM